MAGFFDDAPPVNSDPVDTTEITTTILYFSKEELAEFRKLAKLGIKTMYPDNFKDKGNIADFFLALGCVVFPLMTEGFFYYG